MKVLVTRTDRLGDLVLSLPVLADIKARRPDWELQVMVAPGSVPLVENDPHLEAVWTWTGEESPADLAALEGRLAAEAFDAVVLLQYRQELARMMVRVGIPRRFGPWSKVSSWFLLNRGTWQARSRRSRHEMIQNLRLARRLTGGWRENWRTDPAVSGEPRLYLTEGQREIGRHFRAEEAPGAECVAFVHPGSGGSALDWEPRRFAGVANDLARQSGWKVFVTGAETDRGPVNEIREHLDPLVGVLLDRYPLRDFLGVLSAGDLFVGPSTGPLHMAAALGAAVVGLYPPAPTMSPGRWGPRGPWSHALSPAVDCPSRRTCFRERCLEFNCLNLIAEQDVLAACRSVVNIRQKDRDHRQPE